jgi:hypothetical protein
MPIRPTVYFDLLAVTVRRRLCFRRRSAREIATGTPTVITGTSITWPTIAAASGRPTPFAHASHHSLHLSFRDRSIAIAIDLREPPRH